jgi:hypothetical protein
VRTGRWIWLLALAVLGGCGSGHSGLPVGAHLVSPGGGRKASSAGHASHSGSSGAARASGSIESSEVRSLIALGRPIYCAGHHGR